MARKTSPRGGFFTSEPAISVGAPSLRGGFFKQEEQPTPVAPSELLTRALQSLVGVGKAPPDNALPAVKQAAAISEGYGVGRPTGGSAQPGNALASPLTEKTTERVIAGETVTVPDREYYDLEELEDDFGNVILFRPIKEARFVDALGAEFVIKFAKPDPSEYFTEV